MEETLKKQETKVPTKKRKKYVSRVTNTKRKNRIAYLFLSPWIIGTILFSLIPILMTIYMSFNNVSTSNGEYFYEWAGFSNYVGALTNATILEYLGSFLSTELLYVPVIIVMSFIIAFILTKDIKGRGFFRVIFFLPVIIISGSLVSVIMESSGLAEDELETTVRSTSFIFRIIASYSLSLAEVIENLFNNFVLIVWLTGIPIILFMNAIQKINKNLYEAAKIDGANSWQILWKITIPNCMGIAFIISIYSIIQISTLPISDFYGVIQDGLGNTTNGYGLVSAYSVIYIFVILVLIGIFAIVFVRREKNKRAVMTKAQMDIIRDRERRDREKKLEKTRKIVAKKVKKGASKR